MLGFSSKALNDSFKILPALVPVVSCHILWGFIDVTVCSDWVIPEKIHTPTTEGMLENLTGGGLTPLEIQM